MYSFLVGLCGSYSVDWQYCRHCLLENASQDPLPLAAYELGALDHHHCVGVTAPPFAMPRASAGGEEGFPQTEQRITQHLRIFSPVGAAIQLKCNA